MKKIHVHTLPIEALNGLIHGFHHYEREKDPSRRSLYYIDVTAQTARHSLFSILRKEKYNIEPVGYDGLSSVIGTTLPAISGAVLSANLLHVDRDNAATHLHELFNAMRRSGLTTKSTITIYGEPGIEKLMQIVSDSAYKAYVNSEASPIKIGNDNLTTNLPFDTILNFILGPEQDTYAVIGNSPADGYTFGPELKVLDSAHLLKLVSCIRRLDKNVILHPELHRKFYDDEISIYKICK